MQLRKLFFLTVTLGIALVVAAFGTDGLKNLLTTQISPAEAAGAPAPKPSRVTVAAGPAQPIGSMAPIGSIGGISQTVTAIEFVPAPELPARAPDAGGVFTGREGQTLTLQSFYVVTGTPGVPGVAMAFGVATAASSGSVQVGGPVELGGPGQADLVIMSGTAVTGEVGTLDSEAVPVPGAAGGGLRLQTVTVGGEGVEPPAIGALPAGPVFTAAEPAQTEPRKVVVTDATKIYHDVTPTIEAPAGGKHTLQQVLAAGSLDEMAEPMMVTVWGHLDGEQLVADVIVYQNPFLR